MKKQVFFFLDPTPGPEQPPLRKRETPAGGPAHAEEEPHGCLSTQKLCSGEDTFIHYSLHTEIRIALIEKHTPVSVTRRHKTRSLQKETANGMWPSIMSLIQDIKIPANKNTNTFNYKNTLFKISLFSKYITGGSFLIFLNTVSSLSGSKY